MYSKIRTAVAAIAADRVRRDAVHALSCAGIELAGLARSGDEALELAHRLRPDLLVADAQLPVMDGCTLLRRIRCSFCLPVRPAAVLLHWKEFPLSLDMAGCGIALAEKPVPPDAFCSIIPELCVSRLAFTPTQLQHADGLLDALGVPDHIGRECLKQAALMCAADERNLHSLADRVYSPLGYAHHMSAPQAERAIRHVIERAWQSDQFENQYRIFADTVDASRGQPTASEMISRLADILRLEG